MPTTSVAEYRKRLAASASGATRQRAGKRLEEHVQRTADYYRTVAYSPTAKRYVLLQRGMMPAAAIARAHPPTVGAPGKMKFAGQGAVDWVGFASSRLTEGWYHGVSVDLKSFTSEASFAIDPGDKGDRNQLAFLRDSARFAGVASGYLLGDLNAGRMWYVGEEHFEALARGERVKICSRSAKVGIVESYVPSIAWSPAIPGGFDFLALLLG